jgi:hypothetical protein
MNLNFKTAIGSIAPMLATMLGGPLAGTAVTALESALGLTPGAGADGVTAAVATGMTPDQISAVRKADQEHAERLKQMDIDVVKMNDDFAASMVVADNSDRASARDREIKVGGWTVPSMAWLVLLGSLGLTAAVVTGHVTKDPALATIVGTALGSMWSEAKQVLAYYFGSSAGSQAKDATIQAQAKSAASSAP